MQVREVAERKQRRVPQILERKKRQDKYVRYDYRH